MEEFLCPYLFSQKRSKELEHLAYIFIKKVYKAYRENGNREMPNFFNYVWDRFLCDNTPNMTADIAVICAEMFIEGYEQNLIDREGSFHLKSVESLYQKLEKI